RGLVHARVPSRAPRGRLAGHADYVALFPDPSLPFLSIRSGPGPAPERVGTAVKSTGSLRSRKSFLGYTPPMDTPTGQKGRPPLERFFATHRTGISGLCSFGFAAALSFASTPAFAQGPVLPDGAGKAEVVRICAKCHPLDQAISERQDQAAWSETISKMVDL